MNLRRLRAGEWIAAAGGIVLLVSLWTPWYSEPDASAWESLAVTDVLLALLAAAAVGLWLITAVQRMPSVPIAYSAFLSGAAIIGVILVLIRVANLPDAAGGRGWGLWLGLAGALGILAGAWLAMRDERPQRPGGYTDLAGAPAPEPAPIETFRSPPPGAGD